MSAPLRYVALGDSNTAGTDTDEPELRWPDLLARALEERLGEPVEYHNIAVYGVRSADVAAHQLDRALELEPDLITLVCGINDVLMSPDPSIDGYRETLAGMVVRVRRALPNATLVTATIPDLSRFVPYRPRSRARVAAGFERLAEATRSVAREHAVRYVDLAARNGLMKRESFGPDGYHPSPRGHRVMAGAFLDTVEGALGGAAPAARAEVA